MATAPTTDPFRPQDELDKNACVDNFMGLGLLSEYYIRSADALVTSSLDDHCLLDVHVYAICFLYRQGLELLLKDMVWKSHYLLTGEKRFMMDKKKWRELGSHGLSPLWKQGYPASKDVLADGWPPDPEADEQVEQLLVQVERHDPDSYSFRYPFGKNKTRNHPNVNNVNIRALRDRVHEVTDRLTLLLSRLDWCSENQHE